MFTGEFEQRKSSKTPLGRIRSSIVSFQDVKVKLYPTYEARYELDLCQSFADGGDAMEDRRLRRRRRGGYASEKAET